MIRPADAPPAIERFRRGAAAGRIAHAYLVAGAPRGGGGDLARDMLQSVFCAGDVSACGTCRGCRLVAERIHPDILWIEPESKSRRIPIETVRDRLIPHLTRTSLEGGWKAAVLLAADRLTSEAANAFLKTLEEPPPRALILLVTDAPFDILPTLASRCQRIAGSDREPRAPDPWRTRLLDSLESSTLAGAIGRLGMAARVASLFEEIKDSVEKDQAGDDDGDDDGAEGDVLKARVSARTIEIRRLLLRELLVWQRDVLAAVLGLPDETLRNPERARAVRREAEGLDYADAMRRIRETETMDERFARNLSDAAALSAYFRALPAGRPAPRRGSATP